jgi:hypothetical protein
MLPTAVASESWYRDQRALLSVSVFVESASASFPDRRRQGKGIFD